VFFSSSSGQIKYSAAQIDTSLLKIIKKKNIARISVGYLNIIWLLLLLFDYILYTTQTYLKLKGIVWSFIITCIVLKPSPTGRPGTWPIKG